MFSNVFGHKSSCLMNIRIDSSDFCVLCKVYEIMLFVRSKMTKIFYTVFKIQLDF